MGMRACMCAHTCVHADTCMHMHTHVCTSAYTHRISRWLAVTLTKCTGLSNCTVVKRFHKGRPEERSRSVLTKSWPTSEDLNPPSNHPAKKTHGVTSGRRGHEDTVRATKNRNSGQIRVAPSQALGRSKAQSTWDAKVTVILQKLLPVLEGGCYLMMW